jgi:hypothetical protein
MYHPTGHSLAAHRSIVTSPGSAPRIASAPDETQEPFAAGSALSLPRGCGTVAKRSDRCGRGRAASLRINRLETPAFLGSEPSVALAGMRVLVRGGRVTQARAAASSKKAWMNSVLRIYI